jgi:ABC-type uncharacterized transport system substrate-binding protein
MFFDSAVEVVFEGKSLKGAYITWTFDHMFSADILRYDANKDGVFNAAETRDVYDNAFINLRKYYYFTFIRQGSKRSNPSSVREFSVSAKAGKVSYRFFVDLSSYPKGALYLAIYDYTYFCEIRYPDKGAVTLRYDPALIEASYEIETNTSYPVYFDPLGAVDDTTVYYEWRKGLNTFYPREICIRYAER